MKVHQLIAILKELDQDIDVVLSKDSEGNRFSPCSSGEVAFYQANSTWEGDLHPCKKGGENCIVLWPIN